MEGKSQFGTYTNSRRTSPTWKDIVPRGKRMHSTDVAFRNEPRGRKQPRVKKLQDMEVEMTWRKAQEPGPALPQAQAPPEWCNHLNCAHV